jgi:hypothetical protein
MMLPSILALDPGGTTGYCFRGPSAVIKYGELPLSAGGHHLALWKLLVDCRAEIQSHDSDAPFIIVCERFDFRKDDQARAKIDYIAREYIGVVRLYDQSTDNQVLMRLQGANEAKGFWDDGKLRRIGMYYSRSKHARDATRHYLYYVTFNLKDERYLHMLR